MVEKAFRLSHDCELYKDYFRSLKEKKHFARLGSEFLNAHDIPGNRFTLSPRLHIHFNSEEKAAYASQILKDTDERGFSIFKLKSPIGKAWEEEVVSHVDMETLDCTIAWWLTYIGTGSYALWHHKDEVYGYLSSRANEGITLSPFMIPLKLSEYYAAMEAADSEDKCGK